MSKNNNSYISTGKPPFKFINNHNLIKAVKEHKIIPYHVQLSPTNVCNLNCKFCSCRNVDRTQELSFPAIQLLFEKLQSLGTKAITISGGGEPLCYNAINDVLSYPFEFGLVTNGYLLSRLKTAPRWVRISISDETKPQLFSILDSYFKNGKVDTDWAFSYVVTDINYSNLAKTIEFANYHSFTHVRIVSDVNQPIHLGTVKAFLEEQDLLSDKIIFHDRVSYKQGHENCLHSLLSPVIGADGNLYGCCNVQFSNGLGLSDKVSFGNIKDIDNIYNNQLYFNGKVCGKCFINDYNEILNYLWTGGKHEDFI